MEGHEMNKTKRNIIIVYCIGLALVCTFVPWKAEYQGVKASMGYSAIWSPPKVSPYDPGFYAFSSVDFSRVILEIIGLTALAAIAIVSTKNSMRKNNTK
jgi:hypothetical protein